MEKYIRYDAYVGDEGIYVPTTVYMPDTYAPAYRCLITKELFVEAYNKWIKESDIECQ